MALKSLTAISVLTFALCAGCSSGSFSSSALPAQPVQGISPTERSLASNYIKHVVVIIQENRSFENFFAGYPNADAPTWGWGLKAGKRIAIKLHQDTFELEPNLEHLYPAAIIDWDNGRMDGFSKWGHNRNGAAYAFIERSQVKPYWDMAHQYVLAAHMFPTEFGPSWTAHLTLIAGTDNVQQKPLWAVVDFSDGAFNSCDSPHGSKTDVITTDRKEHYFAGPYPCFDQFNTMAQDLDQNNITWKYYVNRIYHAGIWSPYEAIKYVRRGPDYQSDMVQPETQVLQDAQSGNLAQVSWVTPNKDDSDHPESHSDLGPSWVSSIVNAVGGGPDWSSTAIIILWDDWGGFYDNAPPPNLDFRGNGIRVPCLIVSPYAKTNYVSKTDYEFGSILKFMEEVFNLQPMSQLPGSAPWQGYTDTRANSLDDSFNFTQPARAFKRIHSKYSEQDILNIPRSEADGDVDNE
jgi:phospholipase C